jgi:hypothetical protein
MSTRITQLMREIRELEGSRNHYGKEVTERILKEKRRDLHRLRSQRVKQGLRKRR